MRAGEVREADIDERAARFGHATIWTLGADAKQSEVTMTAV
jgi:hypothetical protein